MSEKQSSGGRARRALRLSSSEGIDPSSKEAPVEIPVMDPAALVGKDELGLKSLLSDLEPAFLTEPQRRLLESWSKYRLAGGADAWWLSKVSLGEGQDVVAVWDCGDPERAGSRGTDTVALLFRELEEEVPLEGGKTFRRYSIPFLRVLGRGEAVAESAVARIAEIRESMDLAIARSIGGFGVAPVADDEFDDDESVSFLEDLMQPGE